MQKTEEHGDVGVAAGGRHDVHVAHLLTTLTQGNCDISLHLKLVKTKNSQENSYKRVRRSLSL